MPDTETTPPPEAGSGALAKDPEERVLARIRELTGMRSQEMQDLYRRNPIAFVRKVVERRAPEMAAAIFQEIDDLEQFCEFRRPTDDVYADQWNAEGSAKAVRMARAGVMRDCRIHNGQVMQARKQRWLILDKMLAHAIGQPTQALEISRTTDTLTPLGREFAEMGAGFLMELRQIVAAGAAGRDLPPPAAVEADFEILEDVEPGADTLEQGPADSDPDEKARADVEQPGARAEDPDQPGA